MPKRRRHKAGFTLIELIVTMGILTLLLFMLNELFQDTSVAVTRSVQTSKVIAATRIIGEQVNSDFDAMMGPGANEEGFLVIIQQRLSSITMIDPFTLDEVEFPEVRSDQIVFVRDASGLPSMTPQDNAGFGSNLAGQGTSARAKVWYGTAQRTLRDGRRLGIGAAFNIGGASSGLDRVGSDFILGRQAMLFNPIDQFELSKPVASQRVDPSVAGAPALYTHSDTGFYNATVNNTGFTTPNRVFMGITDVTSQEYGPAATAGTFANRLSIGIENTQNAWYLNTTYSAERLRVNTNPDPDQTDYASWAIAQGHGILMPGCSEFIVEFAADLNANGRIDQQQTNGDPPTGAQSDNDANRPVYWYDAIRDGDDHPLFNHQWALPANGIQPFIDQNADTKIFIFRIGDDAPHTAAAGTAQANSSWPYMVRLRYRLHDTRGRLTSNNPQALRDGKDNNGIDGIDESGEDKLSGVWFEHVIKIPRP